MSPTLQEGQMVLVNRLQFKKTKVGEIVAIQDPRDGKILIKRVAKVGKEGVFVIGDNKAYSTDSRKFGMIERSKVIGKVIVL